MVVQTILLYYYNYFYRYAQIGKSKVYNGCSNYSTLLISIISIGKTKLVDLRHIMALSLGVFECTQIYSTLLISITSIAKTKLVHIRHPNW